MKKTTNNSGEGSAWRAWDLQIQPIKAAWFLDIHSKKTEIKNAVREYLKQAIEKKLAAVAITDHNCGAAIDAALELTKEEDLKIEVFAGVEIDANAGFQLLLIFNPQYKEHIGKKTWAETVEHFLNNVCALPSPVVNAHGQAESIHGDIHEILARICAEDIGLPVFAHSQSEKGLFKKTTGANRKKFFENNRDGKYYFALDHKTDAEIAESEKAIRAWSLDPSRVPLLKTSDAHQASEVGTAMSWIKADLNFEGLKQVVYDPSSRLTTQTNQPVEPTNVLESITFDVPKSATITLKQKDGSEKEEAFCFAGIKAKYRLSPYFNCFVGGRGSGKSTVLNFLGQHSKDPDSSRSFWDKLQPSFDVADRAAFSFEGVEVFEFIGQSEIESFATNNEAFTDAIYQRANLLSDGLLGTNEATLISLLGKIQAFEGLVAEIEKLNKDLESKERERRVLQGSIKITESAEYSDITSKITNKSSQKQELEGWRNAVAEFRKSVTDLKQKLRRPSAETVADLQPGQDISQPYREAYAKALANIDGAAELLAEDHFTGLVELERKLAREIEGHEKELSDLLKKAGLSEENILQVKSAPQKLIRTEGEIARLKSRDGELQAELAKYPNVLADAKQARLDYEEVITNAVKPLAATLKIQAEENDKKDIKNIGLSYFFDEQAAWVAIADDFYSHFSKEHKSGERSDYLKGYMIDKKETFAKDQAAIVATLTSEEKKTGYVTFLKDVFANNAHYQIFTAIRDRHLNDVSRYRRIQVLYDNKDIEHASFGQKCTAVMVILLLFGNYPLIIDEPEAHLDSSLIANYLVPLIKKKKVNRQIIFATHNANFVVNGDAEKIFIMKNETGKTEIIETTIEDLANRDDLLKLEGGREAFRKRGEKLHI